MNPTKPSGCPQRLSVSKSNSVCLSFFTHPIGVRAEPHSRGCCQDGVFERAGEEAQEMRGVCCAGVKTPVPPSEPTKKKKLEVGTEKSETGDSLRLTG